MTLLRHSIHQSTSTTLPVYKHPQQVTIVISPVACNLLGPMRKQRRNFLTRATPKRLPRIQCLRPCRICKAQDPQTNSQPTQKDQKTTSQPITGCQFSPLALHAARRKAQRTRAEVAEVARRSSKSGALMAWDQFQALWRYHDLGRTRHDKTTPSCCHVVTGGRAHCTSGSCNMTTWNIWWQLEGPNACNAGMPLP